jgi:triacylglycerol esterase/lipase EstA (alpha/beta hydrolase family)
MPRSIRFTVPGQDVRAARGTPEAAEPGPPSTVPGRIKQSVQVGRARAGGPEVHLDAVPGEDVVVLHLAGGPSLTLHPETARDLLLAQSTVTRGTRSGGDTSDTDEVLVPARLQWRGLEEEVASRGDLRGGLGGALLSHVHIITDLFKGKAADFTAEAVVRAVDAQVTEGVYALAPTDLPPLKASRAQPVDVPDAAGQLLLVLVHGTFSNTSGTFSKLWTEHPQRVRTLFQAYGGRVYGLDHATLGRSPIDNALSLVQALPARARVHLVTHSRGGLVAEVLARASGPGADDGLESFEWADAQADALRELVGLAAAKQVRVERVVRVACPARGTLLASKRLDAYVSVLKWALELGGVPVLPELVNFLGAVAQRRTDPEIIPGLAAQVPDNPLVRWLHAVEEPLPGDLRVVAGDIQGDSVMSWIKTLLADAFYWTDNDLVVQTRSMYGGAPRAAGATFVLDQGAKVTHFGYFANERSAEAIVNALVQAKPAGFGTVGPLSWKGAASDGTRAAMPPRAVRGGVMPDKPAVFVIPGILGSNLKVDGDRIWLGWRILNGLPRLKYQAQGGPAVAPDGPIELVYDGFADFLSETHEVFDFAFDWRKPLEEEAVRLAEDVAAALKTREKSGQPVRIVAHSMGGLLARTMHVVRRDVWERMMAVPGARLLMLGTPNAGSWAPMQVLSGDDTFGNTLANVGAPLGDDDARDVMAGFPGFLQLQAGLLNTQAGLAEEVTWRKLADDDRQRMQSRSIWHHLPIQLDLYRWGVPAQAVLDAAVDLRRKLDRERDHDLPVFADRLALVIGKASFTPDGYETGTEGLAYLNAVEEGDGRVTRASALLPGVLAWSVDADHGGLPSKKSAFQAYLDILRTGKTDLLVPVATTRSRERAAEAPPAPRERMRPAHAPQASRPRETTADVYTVEVPPPPRGATPPATALAVTVVNGDLTFVSDPLLIGHYRSQTLTGTEAVMDRLVHGAMGASLRAGLYADAPGTHQVFLNGTALPDDPRQVPRPEAVVVVGLGDEGTLTKSDLAHTVRQGVMAWSQRVGERPGGGPPRFDLAATLIGTGSLITVGEAAHFVAQGVREANRLLGESDWPIVGHLRLVELYLDRATEACRALQLLAAASQGLYTVTDTVVPGEGALERPLDAGYRGANYDLISAVTAADGGADAPIEYTLDTRRARTEVHAQATQTHLVRQLVAQAASAADADPRLGRTLFNLLVPIEIEAYFGGTVDMVLEVNEGTAGIPWEILDTRAGAGLDERPWAIRVRLLRKLKMKEYRTRVLDATADASVLVIGEPECDASRFPRLPGARAEAVAVAAQLGTLGSGRVKALVSADAARVGPDARTVLNALEERDWRIVHVAGHGEPPDEGPSGNPRGVALSGSTYLGPREIKTLRAVPELVFVNCCHLAARSSRQMFTRSVDHARFAAGVAEKLIEIGVRCVVAAGWAVDDNAASVFATTFYESLLRGSRFIEAVAESRGAARAEGGNTWAAYQCYGDPDWVFRRAVGDAQRPARPLADEFAGVVSWRGLVLALETLAVRARFQAAIPEDERARQREDVRTKIRHLQARFETSWGGMGAVAEAFAAAWSAVGEFDSAIRWMDRAFEATDGTASICVAEARADLRIRRAWERVHDALARPVVQRLGGAALEQMLAEARAEIAETIESIDRLVAFQETSDRLSLRGAAYKRLVLIAEAAGNGPDEQRALENMRKSFAAAERIGRERGLFRPALERMAADLVLGSQQRKGGVLATEDLDAVAKSLDVIGTSPDFGAVFARAELRLYEALDSHTLAAPPPRASAGTNGPDAPPTEVDQIIAQLAELHASVGAPHLWEWVRDQVRFVLVRYRNRTPEEVKALESLLAVLERWAGVAPPADRSRDEPDDEHGNGPPTPPGVPAAAREPRSARPARGRATRKTAGERNR